MDAHMRVGMMNDRFEVGTDGEVPPCPCCDTEMNLSEKIDINRYTYIGQSWDCYNEECDLNYVPKE